MKKGNKVVKSKEYNFPIKRPSPITDKVIRHLNSKSGNPYKNISLTDGLFQQTIYSDQVISLQHSICVGLVEEKNKQEK